MVVRARHALRNSGCKIGKVERVHWRTVRRGRVISTSPRAGTKHRHGWKVRLVVSRGR